MNCSHCYNARSRYGKVDKLSPKDIKNIVNKLPVDKISSVKLMGGEPFDSENIFLACDELDHRRIPFGMTTNGNFDIDTYEDLFNLEMFHYITFSMDGYEEKDARLFRKQLNVHKTLENIKKIHFRYPKAIMCLNIVINNINCYKIYDILSFYASLGMTKINVSGLDIINDNIKKYKCSTKELCIASEQINAFMNTNKKCAIECAYACCDMYHLLNSGNLQISFDYRCRAGREIGYIDSKGNLFPCEAIQRNTDLYQRMSESGEYSLLEKDFFSIWMNDVFNDVYNFDVIFRYGNEITNNKCQKCDYRAQKCGRCYFREKV